MNIDIPEHAKVSDILKTVQGIEGGGHVYCGSERHFSLLKICLIKLQKSDVNVYLLDAHGFTVKQVSARKKAAVTPSETTGSLLNAEVTPKDTVIAERQAELPVAEFAPETEPQEEPVLETVIDQGIPLPVPVSPLPESPVKSLEPTLVAPPPIAKPSIEQGFSHPQISSIRDLEQALRRCKELGLLVIGFSDGLVAVPEALGYGADALSSADALEVESFDAYRGYEADEE